MANDSANASAIGFDETGVYLELRDHHLLSSAVLLKYFKTSSVTSFVRQLHNYGFRTKRERTLPLPRRALTPSQQSFA